MTLKRSPEIWPTGNLARLLTVYAADRARAAMALAIDERLAGALRAAREPMIAAIRFAWWRDVLVNDDPSKGQGEPLAAAWRSWQPDDAARQNVDAIIDGWSALADQDASARATADAFACHRGGGLFALLTGDNSSYVQTAGRLWSLWDLAAHVEDEELAQTAMETASAALAIAHPLPKTAISRPARLALAIAFPDIQSGQLPQKGFSPRHYLRFLKAAFFG